MDMNLSIFGKRTSFKFPPLAVQQLNELSERARLPKDTDVLLAAIDVLAYLIGFVAAGGRIFLKAHNGNKTWAYSPYAPPADYPHFLPTWSKLDEKAPKERRSFTFSKAMVDRLQTIKAASRFQSDSDVVRAAIAVFHELLCAHLANDRIVLKDRRGSTRYYNPFAKVSKVVALQPRPSVVSEPAQRKFG
jgi:hypothetical protein